MKGGTGGEQHEAWKSGESHGAARPAAADQGELQSLRAELARVASERDAAHADAKAAHASAKAAQDTTAKIFGAMGASEVQQFPSLLGSRKSAS